MKTYIVTIEYRKPSQGDSGVLGIYASRAKAVACVREYVEERFEGYPESIAYCVREYGSNLDEGCFYSEDETIEIEERVIE